MDVYLAEAKLWGREWLYRVMVDGEPYDEFVSRAGPLTWSQQWDVAGYYREALSGSSETPRET